MTTTTAPVETTDPARPTRLVGYARVSTRTQDVASQVRQLRAAGCTDVRAERTRAGLAAARAAGRTGGRPTVMSTDRLDVARRLIHDGSTIATAARVIGVSRSTLSRHLN